MSLRNPLHLAAIIRLSFCEVNGTAGNCSLGKIAILKLNKLPKLLHGLLPIYLTQVTEKGCIGKVLSAWMRISLQGRLGVGSAIRWQVFYRYDGSVERDE